MTPTRRSVLTGLAAAAFVPANARAGSTTLRQALDAAVTDPDEALGRLAPFDADRLQAGDRLDLTTARAGLAIDAALARFPRQGGADWYALLLQRSLGTVTPAFAERRLSLELRRLHVRAAHLFDAIGAPSGTIADRYARLWRDDRFLYPDSDAGRADAVADMNRMLANARAHIPAAFGRLPSWCLDAAARPLSSQDIADGRGGYREIPTPTRPGAYVVDLKDIRRRPRWTLPGVVAHELLPGHMIQLGLEAATPPHPLRVKYASAFVEGWGIYAEQLAAKAGTYADPHDALGHLHWLLFRVARARADIGIHLHGWSIDQARARLIEWQGEPVYFAPFDVELARIPREPASRAAEAMAWLTIADAAHGKPPIAYHAALLADGRKRLDDIRKIRG